MRLTSHPLTLTLSPRGERGPEATPKGSYNRAQGKRSAALGRARPTSPALKGPHSILWLAFASLMTATPIAAQEPPGVWFLTAGDEVRLSVGGNDGAPPGSSREELLGWSWSDGGATVARYPGPVAARLHPADPAPRSWHADGGRIGVPPLGIGPGRELLLLGDDEPATAAAMNWAEMLDGVEAAYRHSSPDLAAGQRHGVLEVGRVGRCTIRSAPVGGDGPGWSPLRIDGRRPIEIQRFLRLLDGPSDCGGRRLELSMIPAPGAEAAPEPYLMTWTGLELQPLGFLDLEPTPRAPAVRTLARQPESGREQINLADWPPPAAGGVDLCRAPFMDTLCLKDLRIRQQLATAAVAEPAIAAPLIGGCRAFFDRLPAVPSPHPCSNPRVWRDSAGIYRTGYTGELLLREQPPLVSRVSDAGEVQWLWSAGAGASDDAGALRFPLADGTRIALGMPPTAPPAMPLPAARDRPIASQTAPSQPATSQTVASQTTEPQPAASQPASQTAASQTAVSQPAPELSRPQPGGGSRPSAGATGPEAATVAAAGRPPGVPQPGRRPRQAARPVDVTATGSTSPAAPRRPGAAPSPPAATPAATPTTGSTVVRDDPDATSTEPAAAGAPPQEPPPKPAASAGTAVPAILEDRPLWPLALAALATTVALALLLRGHRALRRTRRRAAATGLAAREPAADLRLDGAVAEPASPDPPEHPAAPATPAPIVLLEPPELSVEPEPRPPEEIQLLAPPALTAAPQPEEARSPLAEEWRSLPAAERAGIAGTLDAIDRLGRWIGCLLPVLDDLEQRRGERPCIDRLPAPARREWRRSVAALRELEGVELGAYRRLRAALDGSPASLPSAELGPETQYLEAAALLDPARGTLQERLRRHLLAPGDGRLQRAVLALQYLIEAFPIEHLERQDRKTYRSRLRRRLQNAGLSTRFHQLVSEISAGLGWQYRQARYYKARLDQPDAELLRQAQDPISLSDRVGYPAGTEAGTVVRLSELFLLDAANGTRTSGRAHVDGA